MSNVVPFPSQPTTYAKQLDWDTLKVVTGSFKKLHPDLLPIVVYRVLTDVWVGDLTDEQIKQALRDAWDQTERASQSEKGLYSAMGFVRQRLTLCLENQALGLDPLSPSTQPN